MTERRTEHASAPRSLFSFAQIQHVLRVEFGRAQRYRYPLACLAIAIDPLGSVRDRLGYEAKEGLLDEVVALLAEATRSSDFVGRTADDRLIAVVPHTSPEGARVLAGRLVAAARGLRAASAPGERVTLSLGLSTNEEPAPMYYDALLEAAFAALDEAASAGGDRCVERAAGQRQT